MSVLIEITGNLYFTLNLHTVLTVKKKIFQITIVNEINSFLIIICIIIQFKMSIYSPRNFVWSTEIQDSLPLVYHFLFLSGFHFSCHIRPQCIAIDHGSIGLKILTILPVFNGA